MMTTIIIVRDDGCGIPAMDPPNVLDDRFYSTSPSPGDDSFE
jgi:hypothetical protein